MVFVAAFDDRKKIPEYICHFLRHTIRYADILFLTPANRGWRNASRESCVFLHPKKLPRFENVVALFDLVFANYSTNSLRFERACFLRWFALNAATSNLSDADYVCLLDTDFILGVDPSVMLDRIHHEAGVDDGYFDFVSQWSPDMNYVAPELTIFKKKTLFEFCLFLLTEFFEVSHSSALISSYFNRIGRGCSGGVCDMTALAAFLKARSLCAFNLRSEGERLGRIVSNFNSFSAQMALDKKPWSIAWDGEQQLLLSDGQQHPLFGVHFQGSAKKHIQLFAAQRRAINSFDSY